MTLFEADRATLDANYNLRAAVPEFQDYFDRYDATSEAFRARWPGRMDLAYGDTPRQAIDLFLPDATDPPLLAFVHGGYWQSQDRKRFAFVAGPLVEAGAAVAMIGYDLAPSVDMDAIVDQIRRALAWLHRHGVELGFDSGRIHVAGHSAGGHLAAMALATDWAAAGLPADLVKGLCPISGVFELEPIRRCYLNDVVGLDPEQVYRNGPLRLPSPNRCPVTVAVGERETAAFHEQSRAYDAHLQQAGVASRLLVQPGADHFAIVMAMADSDSPVVRAILAQMGLAASELDGPDRMIK
jgi:arylformamidase